MSTLKKLLVCAVALIMMVSMVACTGTTPTTSAPASEAPKSEAPASVAPASEAPASEAPATPADTGKVLNIYCWNTEFKDRFNEYYASKVPADVTVNFIETPSKDGAYQKKLDEALFAQEDAAADDKIDIFLIEADYALKYINSSFALDVYGDIGLTEADTADMYQYTKDICTDKNGALKGVSWQACPGGLIYRRSIAKDVLGSDDPATVQAALDSWDKFDAVAAQAKDKGYYMTSGFVADYRVFSNNTSAPWVNANNEIIVDPSIKQWIAQSKTYMEKGYTLPYDIWATESFNESKKDGKAMCYFGPGWFFDFCLMPATLADAEGEKAVGNGSYGDWGLVKGPQGFFWGGTWICGCAGTDNLNLVRDIMKTMTCDKDTLLKITDKFADFTNNQKAMEEVAASDYGHPFLGGQNHIAVLADSAASINMKNITKYDQLLNEPLPAAFLDYFLGNITEAEAYENFYKKAIVSYPELKKPAA